MHLASPAQPAVGVCVASERCTASKKAAGFVRHVAFDITGTSLAGNFRAGQSFGVIPPGVDAMGKPHKLRLYSIASPTRGEDGSGNVVATTVKRTIDEHWETHKLFLGVCSNYLCDVQVGEKVQLTGPSGKRFVLPQNPGEHDYLFFATGTGIAPFRGMIMDLLGGSGSGQGPVRSSITLIMGSPYASDLLYDEQFRALASAHPNFTYLTAISRERQSDGGGPLYVQDRLTTHREQLGEVLARSRTLVYACGLAGMELGILQKLATMLPAAAREQYVQADAETLAQSAAWTRSMLHKQVKTTRRVFLEVY